VTGRCTVRLTVVLACGALIFAPAATSAAKTAKPLVTTYAWYWENQKQESVKDPTSGADVITATPGNAFFCPGAEGVANPEQSCKPGRLPVEVLGGDYESPDKVSAVAFDLTMAPIGSKVTKFKATFLEASDGQSQSYNIDGKKLEACLVTKIFGAGEARRYKERPEFNCSKDRILASRRKAKPAGNGAPTDRFQWTFDLTAPAKKWVEQGQFATGILIRPFEPKKTGPDTANWRVVLEGSENPKGIQTQFEFIPAKLPDLFGGGDLGGGDLGGGDDLGGSTTFSDPATDSGDDLGAGATGTVTPEESSESPTEETAEEPRLASDETASVPGGLPAYVWLALLAGLVGFSAVRSVVFEHASGVRPNGVLAQIHRLNAERRGTAVATPDGANPLEPLLAGVRSVGGKARRVIAKLPLRRKA
jgi:hypothetical protein